MIGAIKEEMKKKEKEEKNRRKQAEKAAKELEKAAKELERLRIETVQKEPETKPTVKRLEPKAAVVMEPKAAVVMPSIIAGGSKQAPSFDENTRLIIRRLLDLHAYITSLNIWVFEREKRKKQLEESK